MTTATDTRQERINLRLKGSAKRALERAASLEGKTVSQFVLTSALAKAEKAIQEHTVMRLNAQDAEAFFDALSQPVRFNRKLAAAMAEHDRRVLDE
nr:DUF1778 domain-containing protein [Thioalkalivibrio sp.]